jgi:K+-transporting ATPase ATPase B chain
MTRDDQSVFTKAIVGTAVADSFRKLDPRGLVHNPVILIVELGALVTSGIFVLDSVQGDTEKLWFVGVISFWLWLTVLFANFSEAIAEGRGKAQANALRATRTTTMALLRDGREVPAAELRRGDVVIVEAGQVIPADGEVIEGVGSVDESAITGESAPVIRESGGDRSAVTGGTRLLSDRLVVEVTQEPGGSFLDRMIALVEGAERRKTPNEIALNILIAGLTLAFLVAVVTLKPFAIYAGTDVSTTVLIALLVALIPTTIGALLSAIGIAGMDRLVRRNVLAMSGRAVEASGDVDVLLLDKTGTITLGNRQAAEFIPVNGVEERELAELAQLASLADETPEGRSIVILAKDFGIRERQLAGHDHVFIPFSASTRMSGIDIDGQQIRKGAGDAIKAFVAANGGSSPAELDAAVQRPRPAAGARPRARRPRRGPHAARRRTRQLGARRHPPEGHRQGRYERALRRAAPDGHPHRDDHRRQPGDRRRNCRRGRCRRLSRRGDPRGEARADQVRAGSRPHGGDDRRRYERRSGARAGRRRRRDEHRHLGGEGGREHGRPRLGPDEADRDRLGR